MSGGLDSAAWFGGSVALAARAGMAAVGAFRDDSKDFVQTGAVYLFVRHGIRFTRREKLTAADATSHDFFGVSVSLSGDGRILAVGSPDDDPGGDQSGSVYVFEASR